MFAACMLAFMHSPSIAAALKLTYTAVVLKQT